MKYNIPGWEMFYGANAETLRVAAMLRKNMTLAELILWGKLKNKELFKYKFRRQHPIFIFIVDFYCHDLKLVIEVDGDIHLNDKTLEHDLNRTAELEKFDLKIIRFTNDEILYEIDNVLLKIHHIITELAPFRGLGG